VTADPVKTDCTDTETLSARCLWHTTRWKPAINIVQIFWKDKKGNRQGRKQQTICGTKEGEEGGRAAATTMMRRRITN